MEYETSSILSFKIARLLESLHWTAKLIGISSPGGGGGGLEYKKVGVLVVSLRGANFRFWFRLGC